MKKEKEVTFSEVLKLKGTIARFEELLGKGAASFIASLLTIWTEDKKLKECDVKSILSAAKQTAILNLPIMKPLWKNFICTDRVKLIPNAEIYPFRRFNFQCTYGVDAFSLWTP